MRSEINVTPLVDVVLVLLIVFMVAVPMIQTGYDVRTPAHAPRHDRRMADHPVVRLAVDGVLYFGREPVAESELAARVRSAIAARGDRLVFFAADGELPYDKVAAVLDLCRSSGATIGIVFGDLTPVAPETI